MIPNETLILLINFLLLITAIFSIGGILWIAGVIIHVLWFHPIEFGTIDYDSWTKEDYRNWYLSLYAEFTPLSNREKDIRNIVISYFSYGYTVIVR